MDVATKSALAAHYQEAAIMDALYTMCAGEGDDLTPAIPANFPFEPGFRFSTYLTANEHLLLYNHKSFNGIISESDTEFAVDIIGTHDVAGWIANFTANPVAWTTNDGCSCNVEKGWLEVYQGLTLTAPYNQSLTAWLATQFRAGKRGRFRGHSQGGPVAYLAAADSYHPWMTLFACPKPADLTLAHWIADKMEPESVSIVNTRDIVPLQPPFPLYRNLIPELCFNSDEFLDSGDIGDRHRMPTCYLPACTP
jgi:hypothetical protein